MSLIIDQSTYEITTEAIAGMAARYMPLKVAGVDDKQGLSAVHEARMDVRNRRISVEKKRKELKAGAIEYGRKVDGVANEIFALLAPIEDHLEAEESIVKREEERKAKESEALKAARLQVRMDELAAVKAFHPVRDVDAMTTGQFEDFLAKAKESHDKCLAEETERAAAAKVEADRLAAERTELARQKAEQAAAQKQIDDERRAIELEKAKAEAAERARIETEQRITRESAAAKARAEVEEAAALRAESLRPDRAKLLSVADAVAAIPVPVVGGLAAPAATEIAVVLNKVAEHIRGIVASRL